jgi:hypothetical protein
MADEVFLAMQEDAGSLGGELRLAAAVKWYELGRLSQETATEIVAAAESLPG